MNLLEKAKLIASTYDETIVGPMSFSPAICHTLVEAMEEIEKIELHRNNDYQRAYAAGFDLCKSILLKHLEVEK